MLGKGETEAQGLADLPEATEEADGGAWIWTQVDWLQGHGLMASPLLTLQECSSEVSWGDPVPEELRSGRR